MTPSAASGPWPSSKMARESRRCASQGVPAPSNDHSSRRESATETSEVYSPISAASA